MAQTPFHESILDIIEQTKTKDVNTFVTLCRIIETTKVPRGHEDIEVALSKLAENGGHKFMDEYLGAVMALREASAQAAKERLLGYNKLYELADGTPIGVMGASHYILDEHGEQVNDGFHEYYTLEDGTLVGKLGAMSQILRDGQPISNGFHAFESTDYGYLASKGSETVELNKDGQPLQNAQTT